MRLFAFHRHGNEDPWCEAPPWALELREMLSLVLQDEEIIMALADDLNNAVTALSTGFAALDVAVTNELAALVAAQAANNGPAITQAVANISAITGKMAADAQALTASIPGATTAPVPPVLPDPVPTPATITPPVIATPNVTAPNATPPSQPPSSAITA
jgi:hypothetical protein